MTITLAGGASTQSRARRPLPPGVIRATTLSTSGVTEHVAFDYGNEKVANPQLLSWVGGQAGLLFGSVDHLAPVPESDIVQRVVNSLDGETHGSYSSIYEQDLTDALGRVYSELFPFPISVRYFSNGSDACAAAVRLARAVTGRAPIATYGYHGAHSEFAHPPQSRGIPDAVLQLNRQFAWGDESAMRAEAERAAAVVVEVPPVPDNEARDFLRACRQACDAFGSLLIIDDVVLGFRIAAGGSLERYGVIPDLVVLGKAISAVGGIAAVLGEAEIVERLGSDVFYSMTFSGSPMPARVAALTVDYLHRNRASVYLHLTAVGSALIAGLNALFTEFGLSARVVGQPERSVLVFPSEDERRLFCSLMIAEGVIVDRPFFPTLLHTMAHVGQTVAAARRVIEGAPDAFSLASERGVSQLAGQR